MDQQDLEASNRPILKLKTSKNPDIADKVKQQLKPTVKNNKDEQEELQSREDQRRCRNQGG